MSDTALGSRVTITEREILSLKIRCILILHSIIAKQKLLCMGVTFQSKSMLHNILCSFMLDVPSTNRKNLP
jgi:hypothetical protein